MKKGDTVGIVVPAGYMAVEKMQACIETLDSWGYSVRLGATTHSASENYFSGTDEERLQDLQQMLDDPSVNAILCARGGYGVSRIIDNISFKKFKKNPKWVIGYSDITVLHAHIFCNYKIASLHAPMAAAYNDGEGDNPFIRSVRQALEGETMEYKCEVHQFNRTGKAKGQLVGGNLALLAHLVGSDSDISTKERILFIEDIGEYLYNIDRMMLQLKRAGKFEKLAGLVIGRFTDNKDTERPFGKNVNEIIFEHVKDYSFPVCFDFPVSHDRENYALKVGVRHKLSVDETEVRLEELREEEEKGE